jgi:hypothetical protein
MTFDAHHLDGLRSPYDDDDDDEEDDESEESSEEEEEDDDERGNPSTNLGGSSNANHDILGEGEVELKPVLVPKELLRILVIGASGSGKVCHCYAYAVLLMNIHINHIFRSPRRHS